MNFTLLIISGFSLRIFLSTYVLLTIDDEEESIFEPRTTGYNTYITPWAEYFNEPNVVDTIGSKWKQ